MALPVTAVVFTRAPLPGRVKTRLIPALGAEGAARLHARMAEAVLARCAEAGLDVLLAVEGPLDHPWVRGLGLPTVGQPPGDLGRRMEALLGPRCLALGTDSPCIPVEELRRAAALEGDAVIGPAEDGGYWTLGWRMPRPELLRDIPWGSDRVLATTLERGRHLDLRLLSTQWDVDRPEDLHRPELRAWLD